MHSSKLYLPIAIVLVLVIAAQGFSTVNAQSRILYGLVYSAATGKPLVATITVSHCGYTQSVSTESNGMWQISYPYGTLGTITFSENGYITQTFQINLNNQWYDAGGVILLQRST